MAQKKVATAWEPKVAADPTPMEDAYLEDHGIYEEVAIADVRLEGAVGVAIVRSRLTSVVWTDALCRRLELADVIFDRLDVSNASWPEADGTRVAFLACRMTGFKLPGASFVQVRFVDCQARYAVFEGAKLAGARFAGGSFADANFDGADLRNAVFVGCDLVNASFNGAKLGGCDFRGAAVEASRLGLADMGGAIITPMQAVTLLALRTGVMVQD